MKIKALICIDLDGTLVDSLTFLKGVYYAFLQSYGQRGSEEEFAALNGPSIPEVVHTLKKRYRLKPSDEQLLSQYQSLLTKEVAPLFPDAKEVLEHFAQSGLTLALVTSAHESYAQRVLNEHNLTTLFSLIITPSDCQGKPAPDLYLKALAQTQIPIERALAIEDSPNGIQAALTAGIQTLYFQGSWLEVEKAVEEWHAQL